MATGTFFITGDDAADELLARDSLALLIGMLLDRRSPWSGRSPVPTGSASASVTLDANRIAAMDVAELEEVARQKPALHRYPGAMAKRIHALCQACCWVKGCQT